MLVDPFRLLNEIEALEQLGLDDLRERLSVSPAAKLVLPYHVVLNRLSEVLSGGWKGSTGRGNGQAVRDLMAQEPMSQTLLITLGDLGQPSALDDKLRYWCDRKLIELNMLGARCGQEERGQHFDRTAFDRAALNEALLGVGQALEGIVDRRADQVDSATLETGSTVVLEGAQGFCLDRQHGTRPHITPYETVPAAVQAGTNFSPAQIDRALLVTRAYGTRHGPGFFPSEIAPSSVTATAALIDRRASIIDNDWPLRFRAGWLDLPMLRHAVSFASELGDVQLVLTCLDRLSWLDEVKLCESYLCTDAACERLLRQAEIPYERTAGGVRLDRFHPLLSENDALRASLVPELRAYPGWLGCYRALQRAERFDHLPGNLRSFVERIAAEIELPLALVSVGASRDRKLEVD
jgi:adenylosuccinate synthase